MALAYRTSTQSSLGTGNPTTLSVTVNSGDALLVIGIVGANTTARTGGAPTRGSQTAIQIGSTVVGEAECTAELWYIASPTTGTADVSVPNSGSLSIRVMAHLFTGTGASLFNSNSTNTSVDDPSLTITSVPAGSAVIDVFASGHKDASSASDSGIYANDEGAWCSHAQYVNHASLGDEVFTWTTAASDDVAFIMAAFQESSTTPLTQGGTDNNASNWSDAARIALGLSASDNNGSNWSDGPGLSITLSCSDSNESNWSDVAHGDRDLASGVDAWQDAVSEAHPPAGETPTPLEQGCTDSNESNWSDAKTLTSVLHLSVASNDLEYKLISHWKLEEDSGSTRVDSHGDYDLPEYNGNVARTTGKIGSYAARFNDSVTNIYLRRNSLEQAFYPPSGEYTYTGWIYRNNDWLNNSAVILFEVAGTYQPFLAWLDGDGTHHHIIVHQEDTTSSGVTFEHPDVIPLQTWTFVCVRWNGTTLSVQVNNSTPATQGISALIPWGDLVSPSLRIGRRDLKSEDGYVDSVSFWHRCLSDAEVASIYNAGVGVDYPFPSGMRLTDALSESHPEIQTTPLTQGGTDTNESNWSDGIQIAFSLSASDTNQSNWADRDKGRVRRDFWKDLDSKKVEIPVDASDTNASNWNDASTRRLSLNSDQSDTNVSNWNDARASMLGAFTSQSDTNASNWNDAALSAFSLSASDSNASNWSDESHGWFTPTGAGWGDDPSQRLALLIDQSDSNAANWSDDKSEQHPSTGPTPLEQGCTDSNADNWADAISGLRGDTLFECFGMSDYTPPVTDDFNRATLGSNWTVAYGSGEIVSNQLKPASDDSKLYWSANTFPADQYAQAKQYGTGWRAVYCRVARRESNPAYITGYAAGISGIGGSVFLRIWHVHGNDWGTYLDAGNTTVNGTVAGDVLRLEVEGQGDSIVLRAYLGGSLIKTLTKAQFAVQSAIYNDGCPGLFTFTANTAIHDDFEAGPLSLTGLTLGIGLDASDSNASNWSDSPRLHFTLNISDNASNWADEDHGRRFSDSWGWSDAVSEQHPTLGIIPLTQGCTDSNESNWSDAARIGFALNAGDTETANWADAIRSAFGLAASDTNAANWSDTTRTTFSLAIADTNAANWNDFEAHNVTTSLIEQSCTDSNAANWSDTARIAFGLNASDSETSNWSDARTVGRGIGLADTNASNWNDARTSSLGLRVDQSDTNVSNWNDTTRLAYGLLPSDSEAANWNDESARFLTLAYADADLLNNWQEALPILARQDFRNETDDLQYWNDACDIRMVMFRDGIGSGNQGNWNDALTKSGPWSIAKADDLANWNDAVAVRMSLRLDKTDVCMVWIGEAGFWTLSDGGEWGDPGMWNWQIGYGLLPTDTQTITDAEAHGFINRVEQADTLALSDAITIQIGLSAADTQTLSDAHEETTGNSADFAESLTQTDSLHGYEYANWVDDPVTDVQSLNVIPLYQPCTDSNESNWVDTLAIGFGLTPEDYVTWQDIHGTFSAWSTAQADQITLTDGYEIRLNQFVAQSDTNASNWNDARALTSASASTLSDSNAANWADARTLTSAMSAGLSDGLTFTDDIGNQRGYRLEQSDTNAGNWNDTRTLSGTGALAQSDQIVLTDEHAKINGYLSAQSDTITLTDAVARSSILSTGQADSMNNLNDAQALSGASWIDLADQFSLTDDFARDITILIQEQTINQSDDLNNWSDGEAYAQTQARSDGDDAANWLDGQASIAGLLQPASDSLPLGDALAATTASSLTPGDQFTFDDGQDGFTQYGYGAGEDLDNWYDDITVPTSDSLSKDDSLDNWYDGFAGFSPWSVPLDDSRVMTDAADLQSAGRSVLSDTFATTDLWAAASVSSLAQSDQLNPADACAFALGLVLGDSLANWGDQPFSLLGIVLALDDTCAFSDSSALSAASSANLSDTNVPNWGDTLVPSSISQSDLGGENLNFLSDAERLYGISNLGQSDNADTWQDISTRGMTLSRATGSDGGANWQDTRAISSVLSFTEPDSLALWSDGIIKTGIGAIGQSDSLGLTDATLQSSQNWVTLPPDSFPGFTDGSARGVGYGVGQDDTLIITDYQSGFSEYGYIDSDSLANWLDDYTIPAVGGIDKSDSFELTDSFAGAGSQNAGLSDTGAQTDAPGVGFGLSILDGASQTDSVAALLGISQACFDSDTAWNDLVLLSGALRKALEDECPVPADDGRVILGLRKPFESDSNLGNWQDGSQRFLTQDYQSADDAANWSDSWTTGYGILPADQFTLADSTLFQPGFGPGDQIILTDGTLLHFGITCEDGAGLSDGLHGYLYGSWADSIGYTAGAVEGFGAEGADNLAGYADACTRFSNGYLNITETLAQTDEVAVRLFMAISVADQIISTDSPALGYALGLSDTSALLDASAAAAHLWLLLPESLVMTDSAEVSGSPACAGTDDLNNWTDGIELFTGLFVSTADAFEIWDVVNYYYTLPPEIPSVCEDGGSNNWTDTFSLCLVYLVEGAETLPLQDQGGASIPIWSKVVYLLGGDNRAVRLEGGELQELRLGGYDTLHLPGGQDKPPKLRGLKSQHVPSFWG